jgi:acetyl-CoA carboxylase biotin carboxylase subunit
VLELTGDKVAARTAFEAAGFPVLPGAGPFVDEGEAVSAAATLGYPLMVKAVMGGGGIGMSVAEDDASLRKAFDTAATRGARFFADPAVLLERFVPGARHVEVQVIADGVRALHLHDRECSVQRRHQKVIEETPSPALNREARRRMCHAAVGSMRAIGYAGAGTVECVLDPEGGFWFLEVNARLQVEHPVTEMVTGVDLVEEQLRVAAGEGLSFGATPPRNGHSIECRIYAEDPGTFLPSPGRISTLELGRTEGSPAVRFDFGYDAGDEVPMFYDALLGKVSVLGGDRPDAIFAMRAALDALSIDGVKTNVPALRAVMEDERFVSGHYDTGLLGK